LRLVSRYGQPAKGSPAIDAATDGASPSEDILGNRRPSGNGVDIGAVEHAPFVLAPLMNLIMDEWCRPVPQDDAFSITWKGHFGITEVHHRLAFFCD
jgi:hypothetical protein